MGEEDFDAHLKRMNLLTKVGKTLVRCLETGRLDPDTLGYKTAVARSTEALEKLAAVRWGDGAERFVKLARDRVRGERQRREDERDHKRKVRERRG